MTHSKGICWIDDCRIPFVEGVEKPSAYQARKGGYKLAEKGKISDGSITQFRSSLNETDVRGRFPANLLVCDDMLNDGSTSKTNNGKRHNKTTQMFYGKGEHYYTGDAGTNSRYYDIDKWFDKIINYE